MCLKKALTSKYSMILGNMMIVQQFFGVSYFQINQFPTKIIDEAIGPDWRHRQLQGHLCEDAPADVVVGKGRLGPPGRGGFAQRWSQLVKLLFFFPLPFFRRQRNGVSALFRSLCAGVTFFWFMTDFIPLRKCWIDLVNKFPKLGYTSSTAQGGGGSFRIGNL